MPNININDGRKKYTINGDENRAFYVNLTDSGIAVRAKYAMKQLEDLAIDETMDGIEMAIFADEEARKQIDYIFDGEVSKAVFGNISPFAVVDRETGEMFFEAFLKAILPEIEKDQKELQKSMEESEKRIAKYTSHYKRK